MYLSFTLVVGLGIVAADFGFLTNFKASLLMSIGSVLTVLCCYSLSSWAISGTAQEYWKGLMRTWDWYVTWFVYCIVAIIVALVCVLAFYLIVYVPKEYGVNLTGIAVTCLVLVLASYFAHIFGTLRGFEVYRC